MTLTQLEYVLAVNEFRHFNKAAKSCHITQPTLSMQLQKLEEELGLILFDRSKNPIIPTIEGEKVISQAKRVIRESKKIWSVVEEGKDQLEGQLNVGVIPTLAPYLIPLFISSFQKNFPKIDLHIEELKTEDIIKYLDEDKLDAGLLVTPLRHNDIVERSLYYEKFLIFASEGHRLIKKAKVKESDLSYEDIWLLNEGHCFREQALQICGFKNKAIMRKNLSFESGSLETLKNLVTKIGGYTFLPEMAVDSLSSSQLKRVNDFSKPVPIREVSLVHGRLFHKERFIDALEKTIIESLPKQYKSYKKKAVEIIEIN